MTDLFRAQDACGCCEPATALTPEAIWNRPGLNAIGYRVGVYASFRQAMLAAIASKPELFRWTARTGDDYGIVLLEMWAYIADILTFYQERAANESYLRTALHRESVLRLAAQLGYRPAAGMAALAFLSFTLDAGKQLSIPVGLRIQSVPGPDEKPQKFETIESVPAEARLNRVRVFPATTGDNPLARSRAHGLLRPGAAPPAFAPGDRLVIFSRGAALASAAAGARAFATPAAARGFLSGMRFSVGALSDTRDPDRRLAANRLVRFFDPSASVWVGAAARRAAIGERLIVRELARLVGRPAPGPSGVEEKEVLGIATSDDLTTLRWSPPVQTNGYTPAGAQVFKWLRKFRLFGYNAPESYLKAETPSGSATDIRWRMVRAGEKGYSFNITASTQLKLDAIYDDLKVGTQLLIVAPDFTQAVSITEVSQVTATQGPQEAPVTQVTLADTVQAIADLRRVTVYELAGPEAPLWDRAFPTSISGNQIYVLREQLAELPNGRTLILDDASAAPQTVTVTATAVSGSYLRITFAPALTRPLDTRTALLLGNVARATHGETVAREVLGSGDASASFQAFTLQKSPVTFVPQPGAPNGAASTLQVRVGDVLWNETPTLYGRAPDERVYTTEVDNDNKMTVRFGDGVMGARLPSGRSNIVASYRQGIGVAGIVAARSLTTLLDRPVGLRSVTNPAAAEGGADPESLEQARVNAPNTVRTFGRIVSLRDFEDAAREYAGVAKARAIWVWEREEQVVRLTVAGDAGAVIAGETLRNLVLDLDSRRDPNRKLVVGTYRRMPVEIIAAVRADPAYVADDVRAAAQQALTDALSFDQREFGQPVNLSDIAAALQAVAGVVFVDVNRLQFKRAADRVSHGATAAAVQGRLRIEPDELALFENPATDALITLV